MVKKIVIAGLFLGGGYFLIKKLLPTFNKKNTDLEVNTMSIEERLALEEKKAREFSRKAAENLRRMGINPDGTFRIKIDFTDVELNIKEKLAEQFGVDEFWNPNNLSSYQGLKGWQPNF